MPKTNCLSARPGSLFNYKGRIYKLVANDTLEQKLRAKAIEPPFDLISILYSPGQEIFLRWVPHNLRD